MPEVSRFYGIVITLNYNDHAPPHFHARYGELAAVVRFDGVVLAGALPARALALVRQWAAQHQADLTDDWERARRQQPLRPIDPLD
jgi:hypothetical protein